jgi:hypothetical protein
VHRRNPPGKPASLWTAAGSLVHAKGAPDRKATSRAACTTTPGGIPVALLVDAPRRRRWPRVLALCAALVAGAIPARSRVQGRVRPEPAAAVNDVVRVEALPPPFHPPGEDRFDVYDPAWSDGLGVDAYVARMASDGMNTLRVFVFTACGLEGAPPKRGCLEPSLGRFDDRAAEAYDAVFEAAQRRGVRVVLSIFAVGFTPGDQWKGWEANPYSAAPGGPAALPVDVFTDVYDAPSAGYGEPVRGAEVSVGGLAPGRWRVTWIDDVTGAELAREERDVGGSAASFAVPAFTRHVAALLERLG